MAVSKGWKSLVVPAMLTGVLGYALATFAGEGRFTHHSTILFLAHCVYRNELRLGYDDELVLVSHNERVRIEYVYEVRAVDCDGDGPHAPGSRSGTLSYRNCRSRDLLAYVHIFIG